MCPALHVALVCKFSHHLIIKYWRPYLLTSSPIYSFFSISTTCCLDLGLSLFWVIVITPDRVYLPLSMSFLFSKKKTGHQDDLFKMKVLIIRSKLCGVTTAHPSGWPLSKKRKPQVLAKIWTNQNPCVPLMGMQNGTAVVENSMMSPQKITLSITTWSSHSISQYIPKRIMRV